LHQLGARQIFKPWRKSEFMDEGIAFNPLLDAIGRQSAVLKASNWGCFPRISP